MIWHSWVRICSGNTDPDLGEPKYHSTREQIITILYLKSCDALNGGQRIDIFNVTFLFDILITCKFNVYLSGKSLVSHNKNRIETQFYMYVSMHRIFFWLTHQGPVIWQRCWNCVLKVVSGQTNGGSRVGSIDSFWYGTVALGFQKIREFAVVFLSVHFRFRSVRQDNS